MKIRNSHVAKDSFKIFTSDDETKSDINKSVYGDASSSPSMSDAGSLVSGVTRSRAATTGKLARIWGIVDVSGDVQGVKITPKLFM